MQKFKIVTLRDNTGIANLGYRYTPNDPVVVDWYVEKDFFHLAPPNERAWLYTFYQEKTPFDTFSESGFNYNKFVNLMNKTPDWIKQGKQFKIIMSDAKHITGMNVLYTLYRYFRDWIICLAIKLKYQIDDRYRHVKFTDEQALDTAQKYFMDYWLSAAEGWGKNKGGFLGIDFNDIINAGSYVLDIFIPGAGTVVRTGLDIAEDAGITGIQAADGSFFYIPDFNKDLSTLNINTTTSSTGLAVNQAGFSTLLPVLLIAGVAYALIKGKK